ncbi:MAG TPA: prenyltransferase [Candidatus Dormibacteraeota bacterium]
MIDTSLSRGDVHATVDAIARVQRSDGSIPWYDGGQVDPWNHVEAAMALDIGGRHAEAAQAYAWLAGMQRADGSWHAAYRDGEVVDATLDTNLCAYIATGLWLHLLCGAPDAELRLRFGCLERALEFVLSLQGEDGAVWWACDANGRPWRRGLVTGSSCIHLSLACAARLGDALGMPHPEWHAARGRVRGALLGAPHSFTDKRRWAMDWYYPVLCGVVTGRDAIARIASRWDDFVVPERGVRCVADRPWITAAETCELALALVRCGDRPRAAELLEWAQHLRGDDAAYWTGANFTDGRIFPPDEQPTWTSAAVVLADSAISGGVAAELLDATL